MITTIIAIIVIIVDSIMQILVYMRVDYEQIDEFNKLQIVYAENDQHKNINYWMPIYPYFFDCFCKIQVSFEGAPFVPRLYTNSKNKHFFVRNINRAVLFLGVIQAILGTLCVIAYGNKLQEIVLMNLTYGVFGNFIKLLYAVGMIVNLVMQLIPILEIMETRQPTIFGLD